MIVKMALNYNNSFASDRKEFFYIRLQVLK